ncbi:barstar family protein [Bradyrhizobium sp. LjRoot220]
MQIIELNAENWRTWRDLYDALLTALGAPEGHGRNLNALIDSMVWGG